MRAKVIAYARDTVLALVLITAAISLVLMIAKVLGIQVPIRIPDTTALAYIAGAYWLTK